MRQMVLFPFHRWVCGSEILNGKSKFTQLMGSQDLHHIWHLFTTCIPFWWSVLRVFLYSLLYFSPCNDEGKWRSSLIPTTLMSSKCLPQSFVHVSQILQTASNHKERLLCTTNQTMENSNYQWVGTVFNQVGGCRVACHTVMINLPPIVVIIVICLVLEINHIYRTYSETTENFVFIWSYHYRNCLAHWTQYHSAEL